MTRAICVGVGAALLLAPLIAGTPEDSVGFLSYAIISFMCAGLLGMGAWLGLSVWRGQTNFPLEGGAKRVALAFGSLLLWALLSLFGRLAAQHSTAYLGVLLHGLEILAANFAIFLLTCFAARSGRKAFYALLLIAVVASAIVAALGVQEYLLVLRRGDDPNTRVNSTSTPDFLAGYLILLLPVTFALFLGASAKSRLSLLYGLVIILQLATIWTSGSRFALVSLVAAFVVFGLALWRATRQGMAIPDTLKRRLLGIGIVIALAGIVAARPLIHRLQHPQANSAAFRVWTWHGTMRMAQANPLLGTGIGTYLDLYPRYALTGFTRLAHNSYLQMAAECGFPGLLLLLGVLGLTVAAVWGRLKTRIGTEPNAKEPSSWLTTVALPDDRLLVCGLLAGLVAGIVQNLIDSDWYVFFLGLIFWAVAGLAVGMHPLPASPSKQGEGQEQFRI